MSPPPIFLNGDDEAVRYDGSPLQWRMTIHGLAIEKGKVFLIPTDTGKLYEPPGGKIETEENALDALAREFREESGYKVEPLRLLRVVERWFFHRKEQQFYHCLMQFWHVKLGEKRENISHEIMEGQWFEGEKLQRDQVHEVIWETLRL